MRVMDKKCPFRLATELKSAAGFDDVVLQCKQNKTTIHRFVQVKHKQDGTEKISVGSLLTKSGEFNLLKYFIAYLKIKSNGKFKGEMKYFAIVTNIDFDFTDSAQHEVRKLRMMSRGKNKEKEISVIRIDTQDEFLDVGDGVRYKFDNSIISYLQENKDFIKGKVGREVSDKEVEDFLNELVFAVNLPNESQLKELFKGEMSGRLAKKFGYVGDNEIFCNDLLEKISDWVKDIKGRFLSPEEGKEFFQKVELWASTLCGIERGVKKGNKGIDKIAKQQHKDSKTLNEIHAAVTAQNNKQRPHKKPYGPRDKKSKAREEGDIEESDEFDEIEALEFVKRALNIENNLQNKEIKKLAQELQYSQLALKLAVTYISEENIVFSHRGRKRIRVGGYLKKCEKIAEKLLDFKSEYKSDRYAKATFITWKITIDAIVQKKFRPEALSILEIMAYFSPNEIYIEEIFSQQVANDKEALWNAVELLNRYSMIKLRKGVVNIYRLVQKVTRLKLQEKGREEEVLRKALELINSYDVLIDNSIVASVWGYVSKYGELIDEFYFNPIYGKWKYTPLHSLAESGSYEAVRCVLTHMEEKHPDKFNCVVNARDGSDSTPLCSAVESGGLDIVQYFINKGADVNAKSRYGITPLHQAVYDGRVDIVEYLIGKGADINAKDESGFTALHWATMMYRVDVAKVLLKHNADVNAKDKDGDTSLHLATKMGRVAVAKVLLEHNVDVNVKNEQNRISLHYVARSGSIETIECLIEKGADVNAKDENGNTPLHFAAIMGNFDTARVLLKHNADVDTKNNRGMTALHYATDFDHQELVELLSARDTNSIDDGMCMVALAKTLLKHTTNVSVKNECNKTPLHHAAKIGSEKLTKYFIKEGDDVNAKDENGNTPLHFAAIMENFDTARVLLKRKADVNAKNNRGMTALHYATDFDHRDLVEWLLAHGASIL